MHWSDFHSSARQREFVKSRQFASAGWCDREAVPIFSQLGVPAIVPRLPERGAGTCGGRTAPRPCQGALRAQLGRRDTCPCSCTPQWPWCPHLQLPTPRRRPCAGAGGGSPQMRGLGRSPSWWHLGSSGAVPGLAGDGEAPAPPAGGGHPSAGGDAGGASLPTGYRGSQDIELRWDVHFVHGERWEKLRLRSCSHRDPLAGVGTWGQSCRGHRVCLGWRWKCSRALGDGSCTAELSLLLEQLPQPGAHLSCPPFTPASRSEDFPTTAGWSHP